MTPERPCLYRARDGMLLGVCKGIARYRNLPVGVVRLAVVVLTIATGFWLGIGAYILAGFLMDPEPALAPQNPAETDFYTRYRSQRASAFDELRAKMTKLDARLQRMEDKVTRPSFDWDARMRP